MNMIELDTPFNFLFPLTIHSNSTKNYGIQQKQIIQFLTYRFPATSCPEANLSNGRAYDPIACDLNARCGNPYLQGVLEFVSENGMKRYIKTNVLYINSILQRTQKKGTGRWTLGALKCLSTIPC